MAETIRHGTTGFVQSFRDPAETAALLRSLWGDEARYAAMRRAARKAYEAEFTELAFAKALAQLQSTIFDSYRPRTGP